MCCWAGHKPDILLLFATAAGLEMAQCYTNTGREIIRPSEEAIRGGLVLRLMTESEVADLHISGFKASRTTWYKLSPQQQRQLKGHRLYKALKKGGGKVVSEFFSNFDGVRSASQNHFSLVVDKVCIAGGAGGTGRQAGRLWRGATKERQTGDCGGVWLSALLLPHIACMRLLVNVMGHRICRPLLTSTRPGTH